VTGILSQLAVLAFASCGLLIVLGLKKHAGKLAMVGAVLAVAAAITPRFGG
jgi:hypothetical protein